MADVLGFRIIRHYGQAIVLRWGQRCPACASRAWSGSARSP